MKPINDPADAPRPEQKILIVDDREENLYALERTLGEIDATIIKSRSGDNALRASLNHEFALAIVDVKMPGMDGYELAELLRSDKKTRHLPIIFLSASALGEQDIFRGYESGAVDYIVKPFNPFILLSKVRVFLELVQQRDKLNRQAVVHEMNMELEAFSYSVSHDLRAPLRIVQGFADLLLDEHLDQLDSTGQAYMRRIAAQVEKMDTLINDLLRFSRLGRQPMEISKIDMTLLASEVFMDLEHAVVDRDLQLQMNPLPPAYGDRSMIRQVLVNLISNAIKYTRSRAPAVVELGCSRAESDTIYHVKDNGVGFDMKFKNKLFEVFQRLHPDDEFDGSGVGLSLVQRIIRRHGGDLWAEGRVDEGATFYFTLPREDLAP